MSSPWHTLPTEIRFRILEALKQDGSTLARLATVSREWQTELERKTFARIRLTPSRLAKFSLMTHRNRALVRYIWFCLELDCPDCTKCTAYSMYAPYREDATAKEIKNRSAIATAFQSLFNTLSTWERNGELILDINIHPPSSSDQWLKSMTAMSDGADLQPSVPSITSVEELHDRYRTFCHLHSDRQWWKQLPSVPAVTSILLRQQNRWRWNPGSVASICSRLPGVEEIHYEPWREWQHDLWLRDIGDIYS